MGRWTNAIVMQPERLSLALGVTNLWFCAGDKRRVASHQLALDYVLDYSLGRGWSLSSGPEMTNDWTGAAGEHWFVPVGGGVSKSYNGRTPIATW